MSAVDCDDSGWSMPGHADFKTHRIDEGGVLVISSRLGDGGLLVAIDKCFYKKCKLLNEKMNCSRVSTVPQHELWLRE